MKPLRPSMRENRRYLLLEGNVSEAEKAILEFIGVLGMSKASPSWIKKNKSSGILSVNRGSLNHVRASFAAWPNNITIKRVSGTLKGLRKGK